MLRDAPLAELAEGIGGLIKGHGISAEEGGKGRIVLA